MMQTTYTGPPLDDPALLDRLPEDLGSILRQENGWIRFDGGLHLRGACREPSWHSLRVAWEGPQAFSALYPEVRPEDIPFAEECLGDQFLLRDGLVVRMTAGLGDVEELGVTLLQFLERAQADPVDFLGLHPLLRFQAEGGRLAPGQLLSAYPPYWTVEAEDGVSLRAVSAHDLHGALADMARQMRD